MMARTLKEKDALRSFGTVLDENFKYDNLETYQEKVEVKVEDLPVPVIGYVDFLFKDKIVDLKLQIECHLILLKHRKDRWLCILWHILRRSVDLFFASSKQHKVFTLSNLTKYKKQIKNLAFYNTKILVS